jgi:hypothetical protein
MHVCESKRDLLANTPFNGPIHPHKFWITKDKVMQVDPCYQFQRNLKVWEGNHGFCSEQTNNVLAADSKYKNSCFFTVVESLILCTSPRKIVLVRRGV